MATTTRKAPTKSASRTKAAPTTAKRPTARSSRSIISESAIRARAYELYAARGFQDGSDFDDWLRAENDLKARKN